MTTLLNLKHYFDDGAVDLEPKKPSRDFTKLFDTVFNGGSIGVGNINAVMEQMELLEDIADGDEMMDPSFIEHQEPTTNEHFEVEQLRTSPHPGDDE